MYLCSDQSLPTKTAMESWASGVKNSDISRLEPSPDHGMTTHTDVMGARRSHTKSRNGCGQCKARRIKVCRSLDLYSFILGISNINILSSAMNVLHSAPIARGGRSTASSHGGTRPRPLPRPSLPPRSRLPPPPLPPPAPPCCLPG